MRFLSTLLMGLSMALSHTSFTLAGSPDDWTSRTIYQIVTDRFNRDDNSTSSCNNLLDYCGGTFGGIEAKLDYISGMGFDAIWISPVVDNQPTEYHGYHAKDLYTINPKFGGSEKLLSLIKAAHDRGMYVMVDVVGNHMGIPPNYDYSQVIPFNDASHYHDCSNCPSGCSILNWSNQNEVETCRLSGLPDLNQSNSYVRSTLKSWITQLVTNYTLDGIRIDTVPEVPKDFWKEFNQAAGVYAVGENFNGDLNYVAPYQQSLDGMLSYPLYFTLRNVYSSQQSMTQLATVNQNYPKAFKNVNLLGTFVDNHDNPRFLNSQNDINLYKSALTYVLFSTGIPIIYYGTEQLFNGAGDPHCREPLWTSGFAKSDMYTYLQTAVLARQKYGVYAFPQVELWVDDHFYAFSRGTTVIATTNVGSNGGQQVRTVTLTNMNGKKLCNIYYPTDCVVVTNNQISLYLNNNEAKVFVPV